VIDATYAIRYSSWATRTLIRYVMDLPAEARSVTAPGTAGDLEYCLAHIVGGEQRYLFGLTGVRPQRTLRESTRPPLELVAAVHEDNEASWVSVRAGNSKLDQWLANPLASSPPQMLYEYPLVRKRVLLAQALHHANDHRTHIGTILGANGLTPPEVDVWAYGFAVGDLRQNPE
jgi:uncharacterized damage-inducible protein DinB